MPERDIPRVLFRVTLPSKLSIDGGFFQPHNNASEYGVSLPMIAKKDLFPICAMFGGQYRLDETGEDGFLYLHFVQIN